MPLYARLKDRNYLDIDRTVFSGKRYLVIGIDDDYDCCLLEGQMNCNESTRHVRRIHFSNLLLELD